MLVESFIESIICETLKKQFGDTIQEKEILQAIRQYLERVEKQNLNIAVDEEIDFGKLQSYILGEMGDDLKLRLLGDNDERQRARDSIARKSIQYAAANTSLKEERVRKIVFDSIDIARQILRKEIPSNMLMVSAEIEDCINDSTESIKQEIEINRDMLQEIKEGSPLASDNLSRRIESGDMAGISDDFKYVFDAISPRHKLYPHYGFRLNSKCNIISYPMNEDAHTLYPESMRIVPDQITLGENKITSISDKVLNQSYCRQIPINMHIAEASKYLGDVIDPCQSEAEELIGQTITVKPPEFPKAFPCCVRVNGKVEVPYLLLRTKEILEDGSIVVSNEEQENFSYQVMITLLQQERKASFSVVPRTTTTNKERLSFCKLMLEINTGNPVELMVLTNKEILVTGYINGQELNELNNEIDLLNKVVRIEEFYSVELSVPKTVTMGEYSLLSKLYDLTIGEYQNKWTAFDFEFSVSDELRETILNTKNQVFSVAYGAETKFSLWNEEIVVNVVRVIKKARIKDLKRLKQKVRVLEIGDSIKLHLVAADKENSEYCDAICSEYKENVLEFLSENKED